MPVNDTTTNRSYQKPNIANTLSDDVGRLRSALDAIDTDMASKAPSAGPTFTGVTTVAAGSAAAPSLTFTGATSDTGLYSPGADQVAISTGGTGRVFVDATGNVGVKASSIFSYAQSANGLANLQIAAEQYGVLTLGSTTAGAEQKYWRLISRGSILDLQSMNDTGTAESTAIRVNKGVGEIVSNVQFYADNVVRATITGVGAVGGTATPTSLTLDNSYKTGASAWDTLKINLFKSGTEAYGFGVGSGSNLDYFAGGAATGAHIFYTSRTERARIDSSGRLLVGTSAARTNVYYGANNITPNHQYEFNLNNYNTGISLINYNNTGYAPVLTFGLSQSATQGTNTAVNGPNTDLGIINFTGNDGTNFRTGATIQATTDAGVSTGDMPTRLVFSTTADGAATPTEAMRINNQRELLIGTTTRTANGGVLQISNGITFPGTQSACSDPNTLDDYEEGTFTPVLRDGTAGTAATATDTQGRYTKIGNVVKYYFHFLNVTTAGLTAGNTVYITGLPFTSAQLNNAEYDTIATMNSATPTSGCTSFNVQQNQTYGLLANQTTTGQVVFTVSQATSGNFDLFVQGTYRVA